MVPKLKGLKLKRNVKLSSINELNFKQMYLRRKIVSIYCFAPFTGDTNHLSQENIFSEHRRSLSDNLSVVFVSQFLL